MSIIKNPLVNTSIIAAKKELSSQGIEPTITTVLQESSSDNIPRNYKVIVTQRGPGAYADSRPVLSPTASGLRITQGFRNAKTAVDVDFAHDLILEMSGTFLMLEFLNVSPFDRTINTIIAESSGVQTSSLVRTYRNNGPLITGGSMGYNLPVGAYCVTPVMWPRNTMSIKVNMNDEGNIQFGQNYIAEESAQPFAVQPGMHFFELQNDGAETIPIGCAALIFGISP